MPSNAAILLTEQRVIKTDGLVNLSFNLSGFLSEFTVLSTQKKYIFLQESDAIKSSLDMFQQKIEKGYYGKDIFLEYRKNKNKISDLIDSKYDKNFNSAFSDDIINVKRMYLGSQPYDSINFGKWERFNFVYTVQTILDYSGEIITNGATFLPNEDMGLIVTAKNFYSNNLININIGDAVEKKSRAIIIAQIAIYIHNINTTIFPLFGNSSDFTSLKDAQNNYWNTFVFSNSSFLELKKYHDDIFNFWRIAFYNSLKISDCTNPQEKLYYLVKCLSVSSLSLLQPQFKVSLLAWMQKNLNIGQSWLFFDDNEAIVLKILNSITEQQADNFLLLFFNFIPTDSIELTLFDLYSNGRVGQAINDSFFGIGTNNAKEFISSLYIIWQASSYNPYQNGVFSETNFNHFQYNHELGTNPDVTNTFFDSILFPGDKLLNYNARPLVLAYESSNNSGFYCDNFFFRLSNDKEELSFTYLKNPHDLSDFKNLSTSFAPKNKILAFQKDYRKGEKTGLYGTYDYLQAVSLVNANIDAAVKFNIVSHLNSPSPEKNNLVPVFLLKYISDKNLSSNIETTIQYTIDIASLVVGGYSVIEKLKYLRSLSGFSPAILAGSESSTSMLVPLYFAIGSETIGFSAASISLFIKVTTNTSNANESWRKEMAEYLMWIEIFAGAASMIAETRLRRATKKLVEKFNEEGLPDELITDPRGVAAQNTLQQISGVALDFAQYAAKEYEKIIVGLRSRIKTSTGAFDIEHFELEFNAQKIKNIIAEIIILERNAGVKIYSRKFVEEFVIMSCRSDLKKKFTYVESLTMLNYYVKVTLVKGFCTGFHNLNDYKLFCNKFKNYTDDFFDALDLDIQKYEVQGSVLFKHHPNNPTIPAGPPPGIVPLTRGNPPVILTPEDFDGRMLISAEDGKKVANYLKKYWTEIKPTLDRRNFSKKRWAFIQKINGVYIDKQFTKGMLNKSILPLEYVDGLKTAVKNNGSDIFFPLNEQGFSEVGGAFIIKGSSYDILPVMEFKY